MKKPHLAMRTYLLTILSSLLIGLASPNDFNTDGFWFLGFIALVPLFLSFYQAHSFKSFCLHLFVFGFFQTVFSNYWLLFFEEFGLFTLLGSAVIIGLISLVLLSPFYLIKNRTSSLRPLIFAIFWALYEYGKSQGFLGFPWNLMAYTFAPFPLMNQIVDTTGIWLFSYLIAFINALIAETLAGKVPKFYLKNYNLYVLTSLMLIFCYGSYQFYKPLVYTKEISLVLVQQNLNGWEVLDDQLSLESYAQTVSKALALKSATNRPDIIVSGENLLLNPYIPKLLPSFYRDFMAESALYHLIGAPVYGQYSYRNSFLLANSQGQILDYYSKQKLVPFAETIPFGAYPQVINFFKTSLGYYPWWEKGQDDTLFTIQTGKDETVTFTTPICFEDAFAYFFRRQMRLNPDLFITPTNDSWSKRVASETQHLVAARYRPIETRKPLVRAANSGITTYIDEKGVLVESLKPFTADALVVTVPLHATATTFYTYFGDWLIGIFLGFFYVILFWHHKHAK